MIGRPHRESAAQRLAAGLGLIAVILLAALVLDSVAYGLAVQASQERTSR